MHPVFPEKTPCCAGTVFFPKPASRLLHPLPFLRNFGPGAPIETMHHDSPRLDHQPVSSLPKPQKQITIFIIQEKPLIEKPSGPTNRCRIEQDMPAR